MVTKKQLDERFSAHLEITHGFGGINDLGMRAVLPNTVSKGNVERLKSDVLALREIVGLLLGHLGLELKNVDAAPSHAVLIKKQKAKA